MRILHLSTERTWRGGEQQIAYLMSMLESFGVENILLTRSGSEMQSRYPNSISLPFKGEWDFWTAYQIQKIVKERKVDLIHAHTGHGHTLSLFSRTEIPVIVSKRTDYPVKNNFISHWKFNHPRVAKFLCVSDKIREVLTQDIKDPAKAMTVYSGIDLNRLMNKTEFDIRSLVNLPSETKIVVSTAALADQKDYPTFLKVASITKKLHPQIHYVICGNGPMEAEIKNLSTTLGVDSHVHFLGFRDDLPKFIATADAFLITSKVEGLGTSILDAFALKIPVIATAAGGIPEIVKHGETGLLAPVGDASMLATHVENIVLMDGMLKQKLIDKAFELVQKFSYESTAKRTFEVYQSLLN